jgi:hypothetical protein
MKKKTIEEIQNFIKLKYPKAKLVSTHYNNFSKLELICEDNHTFFSHWNNLSNGSWCIKCSGCDKKTIKFIKNFIDQQYNGSKLLSEEYKNNKIKLDLICENGHSFKMSWNCISKGFWCNCHSNVKKITIERLNLYIKDKHPGAILISNEYLINSKLDLICENNHKFKMSAHNILSGHWCAICLKCKKKTIQEIQQFIDINHCGGKLISKEKEYKNNKTKLNLICEKGHSFKMNWDHLNRDCWCPSCKTKGQAKLKYMVEKIFGKYFVENIQFSWLKNPETNRNLDLDIYGEINKNDKIMKLAFEYQGYQHYTFPNRYHKTKEKFDKQCERDNLKRKLCKNNGIILIEIKEFKNFKEDYIIKNILKQIENYPDILDIVDYKQLKEIK